MIPRLALISVLCACACARACGQDAEELTVRAANRLGNGDAQGALVLVERALDLDPDAWDALSLRARIDRREVAEFGLRCLESGRPFRLEGARELVRSVAYSVWEVDPATIQVLERLTMLPVDDDGRPQGPLLPDARLAPVEPVPLPQGPLRCEAFGLPVPSHRAALRRIADRLRREEVHDAVVWSGMSALHQSVADTEAALAALDSARPATHREQIACALAGLRATREPLSWWRQRCLPLLDRALPGSEDYRPGREVIDLLEAGMRVLGSAADREGFHDLARGAAVISPDAAWYWLCKVGRAMQVVWFADEVHAGLESERDPTLVCLRAALLLDMLHYDRALDELERLVEAEPDCGPAWQGLWDAYGRCGLDSLQYRAGTRLVELSRAANAPPPERLFTSLSIPLLRLARGLYGRDRAIELGRELLALHVSDEVRASVEHEVGMRRTALDWTVGLSEEDVRELDSGHESLRLIRLVLSAAARNPSPSTAEDRALRAFCQRADPILGPTFTWQRARDDLAHDPSLHDAPSASYILSLLMHPVFEAEKARDLRTSAWREGCRAPGLVADLARDGLDVLDELSRIDPSEARLVRALRAEGATDLETLIESEVLPSEMQRAEALSEIARRNGRRMTRAAEYDLWMTRFYYEDYGRTMGASARAIARRIEGARGAWPGEIADAWRCATGRPGFVPQDPPTPAVAWLQLQNIRPSDNPDLFAPPTPDVTLLLKQVLSSRGQRGATDVVRRVRDFSKLHPLDIRWQCVEREYLWEALDDEARRSPPPWTTFQRRNARAVFVLLGATPDAAAMHAALDRHCEMLPDETPGPRAEAVPYGQWTDPAVREVVGRFLSREADRCRTEDDRFQVATHARSLGFEEIAAPLWASLRSSSVSHRRWAAFGLDSRTATPPSVAEVEKLLEWTGWDTYARGSLLHQLLYGNLTLGDGPGVVSALERLWAEGALSRFDVERCLDTGDCRGAWPRPLARCVLDRIEQGTPPMACWFVAAHPRATGGPLEPHQREAGRRLAEAGYCDAETWIARWPELPEATRRQVVEGLRRVVEHPPAHWDGYTNVYSLCQVLISVGAFDEALQIARGWSDQIGELPISGCTWTNLGLGSATRALSDNTPVVAPPVVVAAGLIRIAAPPDPMPEPVRIFLLRVLADAEAEVLDDALIEALRVERACILLDARRPEEALPVIWSLWRQGHHEFVPDWSREVLTTLPVPDLVDRCVDLLLLESRHVQVPAEQVSRVRLDLGSDSVDDREAATGRLREMGVQAVPILRELQGDRNPEVFLRARSLLQELAFPTPR